MSLTVIIIAITGVISVLAFNNAELMHRFILNPYTIHRRKEWWRMLTSGFLHADFGHLFFNMFSLYLFGEGIEEYFQYVFGAQAPIYYILLYVLGIIVANLPDTFSKKDQSNYNALGASGGVSSVVFAYIMFNPTTKMGFIPLPPIIPAWIFGILYLLYSRYMSQRQYDNVGHTAHIWGALWGIIFVCATYPPVIQLFIQQITQSFQ